MRWYGDSCQAGISSRNNRIVLLLVKQPEAAAAQDTFPLLFNMDHTNLTRQLQIIMFLNACQSEVASTNTGKDVKENNTDRIIAASRVIIVNYSKLNSVRQKHLRALKGKNYLTCVSSQSKQKHRRNNLSFSINMFCHRLDDEALNDVVFAICLQESKTSVYMEIPESLPVTNALHIIIINKINTQTKEKSNF